MPRKTITPKFDGGSSVSQIEKSPSPFWIAIALVAALAYGFGFLWLPLREGVVGDDGETISRARYIFTSIFFPEMRFSTWIDGGRLPIGFSDRIPIIVGTCVWLGLSAWIGLPLVKPIYTKGGTWSSRIEQSAFAILVGLGLLSSLVLLVGLLGGLQSGLGLCAAIAVLLLAVHCITRYASVFAASTVKPVLETKPLKTMPVILEATDSKRSVMGQILFVAVVGLTCIASTILMLGAWLPPSEFDVVEYHLQAPKEFFQAGAIRFVPHNIYANMPLGIEMHSLAMMTLLGDADAWWGGLIGKSITCSISIVGAALLGAFVSRKHGAMFGWSAAGLWLTSPGIAQVAMFGLIDGALAAYVLASAIATYYALEAMRDCEARSASNASEYHASWVRILTYWRLAGLTSGAAAAAKYPGLILAVVPVCAFFAGSIWRYRFVFQYRDKILIGSLFALELTATCGLWYAKNWVFTGNPVYPLVASVLGGKTLTPEKIEQWKRAHLAPDSETTTKSSIEGKTISPIRSISILTSDTARLVITSSFVQPAMLFGLFLCIFAGHRIQDKSSQRLLLYWGGWSLWIVLVWWFATHRIDRFWLPLTGLWAGLGAIGFWWLYQNLSPHLSQTIVVLGLSYGCILNSSPATSDNRFFVSLNALRQDVGDKTQVPKIFPTTAWINWNLTDSKTKVLLIGEARVFEFLPAIEYSTCFDVNPGEIYLRGKSRDEQLAALHERRITHVLIQWTEINRYRKPNNYGFSDWPQPTDIQKLVDDGVVSRVDWGFPLTYAELLEVK